MTDAPKITQQMINLYDEYTHITLDRRAYLGKLTALVGSTAAAVATHTSSTSLPSTTTLGMPKARARSASLPAVTVRDGVNSPYRLFSHKKINGSPHTVLTLSVSMNTP